MTGLGSLIVASQPTVARTLLDTKPLAILGPFRLFDGSDGGFRMNSKGVIRFFEDLACYVAVLIFIGMLAVWCVVTLPIFLPFWMIQWWRECRSR